MENTLAFIVAVPTYKDKSIAQLPFCSNDVVHLQSTLQNNLGLKTDNIIALGIDMDNQICRTEILRKLNYISKISKDFENLIFYFSGHGTSYNKEGYLVTFDTELDLPIDTSISISRIRDELSSCAARKKILILDSCFSGLTFSKGHVSLFSALEDTTKDLLSQGWTILASCKGDEVSYPFPEKNMSVFTYFLIEALKGNADSNDDGLVTIDEIHDYVFKKVAKWAMELGKQQTPTMQSQISGSISFQLAKKDTSPTKNDNTISSISEIAAEIALIIDFEAPSSYTYDKNEYYVLSNRLSFPQKHGYSPPQYETITYSEEERVKKKKSFIETFKSKLFAMILPYYPPSQVEKQSETFYQLPFGSLHLIDTSKYGVNISLSISHNKMEDKVVQFLKDIDKQDDFNWRAIEYHYNGMFYLDTIRTIALDKKYKFDRYDLDKSLIRVVVAQNDKQSLYMSFSNGKGNAIITINKGSSEVLPKEFMDIIPVKEFVDVFRTALKTTTKDIAR